MSRETPHIRPLPSVWPPCSSSADLTLTQTDRRTLSRRTDHPRPPLRAGRHGVQACNLHLLMPSSPSVYRMVHFRLLRCLPVRPPLDFSGRSSLCLRISRTSSKNESSQRTRILADASMKGHPKLAARPAPSCIETCKPTDRSSIQGRGGMKDARRGSTG